MVRTCSRLRVERGKENLMDGNRGGTTHIATYEQATTTMRVQSAKPFSSNNMQAPHSSTWVALTAATVHEQTATAEPSRPPNPHWALAAKLATLANNSLPTPLQLVLDLELGKAEVLLERAKADQVRERVEA